MGKFRCVKKCFTGGRIWRVGQVFHGVTAPCAHFVDEQGKAKVEPVKTEKK